MADRADKPKPAGKLGLVITVAVALLAAAALIWVPEYQINQDLAQDRIQQEDVPEQVDRYRRTLAQILGGAAVLLGLYFTYRRIRSTERNVEIAREGQITERFTRAIEQLGDEERLEMRLGGIYALERIARDSEKDHWTVMEILTAFVRESTPLEKEEPGTPFEQVKPDVQAALTVIGRRNTAYDPEGRALNLVGARVPGASLIGADFSGAQLAGADFRWAFLFSKARLVGVDFTGADLTDASYDLKQLAEAESVEWIKGLSDEELTELERLRQASDESGQQPREEGDSQ